MLRRRSALAWTALLAVASPAAGAQRLDYDLTAHEELTGEQPEVAPAAAATEAEEEATPFLQYSLLDRLEWLSYQGADGYSWDYSALLGGPRNAVWLTSAGDGTFGGSLDYLELQALYTRTVAEGWYLQAGLRWDARPRPDRLYLALGGQADVTEFLWLGAHAYLSDEGELSGRAYGQYNLELIGPFVLQPSFEVGFSGSDVPALGIGRGLSYGEAGLRLRYRLVGEKLAPYVGLSWERLFGRTARMARAAGDDVGTRSLVLGVRSQF